MLARRRALVRTFVHDHPVHRASVLPQDALIGAWLVAALPAAVMARSLPLLLLTAVSAVALLRGVPAGPRAGTAIARLWYPFALVPLLYAALPALNTALHGGRYFDGHVQAWEAALFGEQPARTLALALPWPAVSETLHAAYLSYYVLIWLPPLLLYLSGDMRGFLAAATAFVLSSLLCFLVFVYFPVQGPRYLFATPAPDGPLLRLTHAILESGSSRGAAFPSGHVAVAVAQAVIAWIFMRRHAWWISLLAMLLAVSTVYGGFHYAVDAIAGAFVGVGAALGAVFLAKRSWSGIRGRGVNDAGGNDGGGCNAPQE